MWETEFYHGQADEEFTTWRLVGYLLLLHSNYFRSAEYRSMTPPAANPATAAAWR